MIYLRGDLFKDLHIENKTGFPLSSYLTCTDENTLIKSLEKQHEEYIAYEKEIKEIATYLDASYKIKTVEQMLSSIQKPSVTWLSLGVRMSDFLSFSIIEDYTKVSADASFLKIDLLDEAKNAEGIRELRYLYFKGNEELMFEIKIQTQFDRLVNNYIKIYSEKFAETSQTWFLTRKFFFLEKTWTKDSFENALNNARKISFTEPIKESLMCNIL